jgi:hypothetical protein
MDVVLCNANSVMWIHDGLPRIMNCMHNGNSRVVSRGPHIERQTQIVAEICQNRTADKDRFFRGLYATQIEKCKTNDSLDITWGICTRNCRSKRYSENFHEFVRCSAEIYFRTATSPNLTSLKLEVLLGTTTK